MLVVGQEKIAEVFGVAPKTIVEWQREGFPIAKQGKPGVPSEYRTEDCIQWFVQRELAKAGIESAKDRLARLQGDKVELELAAMRRDLIPASEVEPALQQFFTDHCAEIEQIPDEFADAVAAVASDPIAVHQVLKDIVVKIKDSCARYEFSAGAGQEGGPPDL